MEMKRRDEVFDFMIEQTNRRLIEWIEINGKEFRKCHASYTIIYAYMRKTMVP